MFADQQRVVDEHGDVTEHVSPQGVVTGAHRLCGLQRHRRRKRAEPGERRPHLGPEQVVAPLHHLPERALAWHPAGRRPAKRQLVPEPSGDLRRAEHAQLTRRQLDRQRQTVELPADLGHLPFGDVRVRRRHPGPLGEQLHGVGRGQGMDRTDELAVDAERPAAGGHHSGARAGTEDGGDQLGRRLDDMLTVVEHHERGRPMSQGSRQG